jgi:hypothetical protein
MDYIICSPRLETVQKLERPIGKQHSFAVKEAQVLLVKRWSVSQAENGLFRVAVLKLL